MGHCILKYLDSVLTTVDASVKIMANALHVPHESILNTRT